LGIGNTYKKMEIITLIDCDFDEKLPNINDDELRNGCLSDFTIGFEMNNIQHIVTGNVAFDIIEEEHKGSSYSNDYIECYLQNFIFGNIEVQEMEEETYITLRQSDLQTLKNEIENYITNKFEE
jgi:hypothetical protein